MSIKHSFVRNIKWPSSITGVVQVTEFKDSPEISPVTEILAKGWDGQKSQIGPTGPILKIRELITFSWLVFQISLFD